MNTITVFKSAVLLAVCALGMQTASAQSQSDAVQLFPSLIRANVTTNRFTIQSGSDGAESYIQFNPKSDWDDTSKGTIVYVSATNTARQDGIAHDFLTRRLSDTDWTSRLIIRQNGQVQIGSQKPNTLHADYKLSVDGKLVAKSIYVTNPTTWADFVFEPTYKRMSLPALETYLLVNKHLPAVPSAKEVEANGYSVNEMDAKLLQSIEELTLHVIELSKQNEQMRQQNVALQADVAELKTKVTQAVKRK
jgi:hypothetical protein